MIRAENITKSFGSLQVLKGIDVSFEPGKIVSIVGPSGAGKTTLLQILGTLSKPDSGTITINGVETTSMDESDMAVFRNITIGFVFPISSSASRVYCIGECVYPCLYR